MYEYNDRTEYIFEVRNNTMAEHFKVNIEINSSFISFLFSFFFFLSQVKMFLLSKSVNFILNALFYLPALLVLSEATTKKNNALSCSECSFQSLILCT